MGDIAFDADSAFEARETKRELLEMMRETPIEVRIAYAKELYRANKSAKVGTKIKCPSCGKRFTKKSYQHSFCSNRGRQNCKDVYWNRADSTRLARALSIVENLDV